MPRQHDKLVNLRCLTEVACCCPLPRHPRSLVRTGPDDQDRSGQPAGLAHFFQTKKIPYASPACLVKRRFIKQLSASLTSTIAPESESRDREPMIGAQRVAVQRRKEKRAAPRRAFGDSWRRRATRRGTPPDPRRERCARARAPPFPPTRSRALPSTRRPPSAVARRGPKVQRAPGVSRDREERSLL